MSPAFLRDIDGPIPHETTLNLTLLWRQMAAHARGRSLDVQSDLNKITNDVIWQALLGTEVGAVKSQIEYLSFVQVIEVPVPVDDVIVVPKGPLAEVSAAFGLLADSSVIPRKALLGR